MGHNAPFFFVITFYKKKTLILCIKLTKMKEYLEFEEMYEHFDDNEKHHNFAADPLTAGLTAVGKGLEMGGKIAEASAIKKQSEAKIVEIGGKRQAQLKDCETNKAYKRFFNPKKRKNLIKKCQTEVKNRLNAEEQEQKEIVRRMTAIEEGKIYSDLDKSKSVIEEKKAGKKLYVIAGIVGLVLVLGTIVLIKTKK